MAIDFSDINVLTNRGMRIPIDSQSEYDAAVQAVSQIYSARPNGRLDSDALNDLESRIRGGQTLNDIIANAYDDANRRFPARDMINNERDTALDIGRDAQTQVGRQFEISPQGIQSVLTSAGISPATAQAAAIPTRQLQQVVSPQRQLATQMLPAMNSGPSPMFAPSSPLTVSSSSSGMSMGTLVIIAGVGLLAFVLLRKML